MTRDSKVYVAGHRGLVGSAIVRRLHSLGYGGVITRSRAALDLSDPAATRQFFEAARPQYVFLAAALVGGIEANRTRPAEFIQSNLAIQQSVIHAAFLTGCKKLLFLGSSCIYPRDAENPISEDALLTGPLEPTNSAYAVAKIAGIEMLRAYRQQYGLDSISLLPTNLYGPGDNYDPTSSHVLPALIRKFHEAKVAGAKTVRLWTGTERREFLHVDDCAEACVHFMRLPTIISQPINIGCGVDVTIAELAVIVAGIVGWPLGEIVWDVARPGGTPAKRLDVTRAAIHGWRAKTSIEYGIRQTYQSFLSEGT